MIPPTQCEQLSCVPSVWNESNQSLCGPSLGSKCVILMHLSQYSDAFEHICKGCVFAYWPVCVPHKSKHVHGRVFYSYFLRVGYSAVLLNYKGEIIGLIRMTHILLTKPKMVLLLALEWTLWNDTTNKYLLDLHTLSPRVLIC